MRLSHEWVLRYIAGLSPARVADLADGALLRGSLAHRMLERFFAEQAGWAMLPDAGAAGWLHDALPRLLAEEGAVLLERGRGADRQDFAATAERALLRLLEHLRAAGVEGVRTEAGQVRRCRGFEVRGSIDLLLRTAAGREIVMDAKWGSEPFHLSDMATGRHLQLAVYAWLRQASNGGSWPYPAYYILSTGNVLAPDRDVFPDAVAAGAEASVQDVWQRLLATRAWRLEQLGAGAIEVNALGAMPDERSVPPPDALPQGSGPGRFDLFRWLTGRGPFD